MYQYTDGGLRKVWLVNGFEVRETPFGEGIVIHDLDGLTKTVCLSLTDKPDLLTGVEFRYIRSAGMLLSQQALGQMMGIDGQSVARWEKSSRLPRWADKLVRLLYMAHAQGNLPIRRAVDRVKTVKRLVGQRLVVENLRGHWEPDIEGANDGPLALVA